MSDNVLHGYYPLGGKEVRNELVKIDEFINNRIAATPFTILEDIVHHDKVVEETDLHSTVRPHMLPSYRHLDVDDLKLSLFYCSTRYPSRIQYLATRLRSDPSAPSGGNMRQQKDIPWGKNGIRKYIAGNFSLQFLVFNQLEYLYDGPDASNRPNGSMRLVLDPEAEENNQFFSAQAMCVRAIKAIAGNRVRLETSNSLRVGKVDIQNTSSEQLESAASSYSVRLLDNPIVLNVGTLILKQKT